VTPLPAHHAAERPPAMLSGQVPIAIAEEVAGREEEQLIARYGASHRLVEHRTFSDTRSGSGDRVRHPNQCHAALDAEVLSDPAAVNVVLLEDFNDEPFDEGVERYIRASRDHELVRERTSLFYNPFWRHLSAGPDGPVGDASFGTYFHRNAEFSRWRTFDQMIFSSSLLTGGSGWMLDEKRTHVLQMPALAMAIASKASVLDHFPIIGHLERVSIHG